MNMTAGWLSRARGLFADSKGPWGPSGGGSDDRPGGGEPPKPTGPWADTPGRRSGGPHFGNVSSLDDFLKRSRTRFGGSGGTGRGP